jgi:hypothetical protein
MATVTVAIPWSQDASAKQSLGLVAVAQSSADTRYDSFLGGDELVQSEMLDATPGLAVRANTAGDCYVAFVESNSSTGFYVTSRDSTPQPYVDGATNTDWCMSMADVVTTATSTAPTITLTALPEAHVATDYYKRVTATGLAPMSFSVVSGALPTGLSLNPETGVLTGAPYYEGSSTVTIQASNAKGMSAPKSFSLAVRSVPSLTTAALPSGKVGSGYSTTLTAAGYPQSYTFRTIGVLPPGLSLNSGTGLISGAPTVSGDYEATFTVSNSPDPKITSDPRTYTLTVGTAPTVSTVVLPSTKVGSAYRATLEATGHKGPYTFALATGSLPAGLTLSAATGLIDGTPSTQGVYNLGVKATNAFGTSVTKALRIGVYVSPVITTTSLPDAKRNTAYSTTISATGYTSPKFTVSSGTLPPGLSLNAVTGVLSGEPTTTSTGVNFTVTATNEAGFVSKAFTIVVESDITPLTGVTVARSTVSGTIYSGAREAATVRVGGAVCSATTTSLDATWTPSTPTGQASTAATRITAARDGSTTTIEVPGVANSATGTVTVSARCAATDAPITQRVAFSQSLPVPNLTVTQAADPETHNVSWTDTSSLPVSYQLNRSVPNSYAPSQLTTTTTALSYVSTQADGAVYGYATTFGIKGTVNGLSTSDSQAITNAWPAPPSGQSHTYTRTGSGGYSNGTIRWTMSGSCPAGTTVYTQMYDAYQWESNGTGTATDKNPIGYTSDMVSTAWSHGGDVRQGYPYRVGTRTLCNSNPTTSVSAVTTTVSGNLWTSFATPAAPVWNAYSYLTGGRGAKDGYEVCRAHGGTICNYEAKRDEIRLDMITYCTTGNVVRNSYILSQSWTGAIFTTAFDKGDGTGQGPGDGWELANGVASSTPWYGNAHYTCNNPWLQSPQSPDMPSFGYLIRDRG